MPDAKESLAFMQQPAVWPLWPVLPVKQRDGMKQPRLGIMREAAFGVKPVVYLTNLFDMQGKQWDDFEKIEYLDFEAIIDDGWVVD